MKTTHGVGVALGRISDREALGTHPLDGASFRHGVQQTSAGARHKITLTSFRDVHHTASRTGAGRRPETLWHPLVIIGA